MLLKMELDSFEVGMAVPLCFDGVIASLFLSSPAYVQHRIAARLSSTSAYGYLDSFSGRYNQTMVSSAEVAISHIITSFIGSAHVVDCVSQM
jgi:hypothetical protein